MPIALILLGFLSLFAFHFGHRFNAARNAEERSRIHAQFVYAFIIVLIVVTGLRNVAVGPDTYGYYLRFNWVGHQSISRMFRDFVNYLTNQDQYLTSREQGYYMLARLFYCIFPSFRAWAFFIAIVFYCGAAYLIKNLTSTVLQALMAFLIFEALFLIYGLSAIRQDFALGCTMFSFKFVRERKLWAFLLLVAIASLVHRSALLFLPYYWLAVYRNTRVMAVVMCIALPFMYYFARPIALVLADNTLAGHYAGYLTNTEETRGSLTFTLMLIGCFLLFVFMIGPLNRKYPNHYLFTNTIFCAMALSPLTWIEPALMRTLLYYSVFLPIIVARVVTLIPAVKWRKIGITAVICLGYLLSIYTAPPYNFFWNQMPLPGNYHERVMTAGK